MTIDLSGKDVPGNEEISKAFDILQREMDVGNIRSFIMCVDFSEMNSKRLGTKDGETRSSLAMAGSAAQLLTMCCNLLYQIGVQFGDRAPMVVIQNYLANPFRTDVTTIDGKAMTQKPGLDIN